MSQMENAQRVHYVCPYNIHFSDEQFIGDPNGNPFVVQAQTKNWIPISVIIFAKSESDAILRIKKGLKTIQRTQIGHNIKAEKILDTCAFAATPFDKRKIGNAAWASNDYLAN